MRPARTVDPDDTVEDAPTGARLPAPGGGGRACLVVPLPRVASLRPGWRGRCRIPPIAWPVLGATVWLIGGEAQPRDQHHRAPRTFAGPSLLPRCPAATPSGWSSDPCRLGLTRPVGDTRRQTFVLVAAFVLNEPQQNPLHAAVDLPGEGSCRRGHHPCYRFAGFIAASNTSSPLHAKHVLATLPVSRAALPSAGPSAWAWVSRITPAHRTPGTRPLPPRRQPDRCRRQLLGSRTYIPVNMLLSHGPSSRAMVIMSFRLGAQSVPHNRRQRGVP